MARGPTQRVLVRRLTGDESLRRPDEVAVEEPLEIRIDGQLVTTTLRTPGHDHELAVGFCSAEGLLVDAAVRGVRSCGTGLDERAAFNIVDVSTGGRAPRPRPRLTPTTAACGACGAVALDELVARLRPLRDVARVPIDALVTVPDRVRPQQDLFARTGGVHAAAALDRLGDPVVVREDVGRHNAVDKVVGRLRLDRRLDADEQDRPVGLYVSGRAGFDIVQKAWAAGFASVVAVGAPTSLAVELCRTAGITLAGFARGGGLNLYAESGS